MATTNNAYRKNLEPVIAASWFTVDSSTYVYASVNEVHEPQKHLLVVRDGTEITIATDVKHLPLPDCIQVNKDLWKLINIGCGNPFYCVGFISAISDALATAGIDIVIVSSFSNDLVLVMENDLPEAVEVLLGLGFRRKEEEQRSSISLNAAM